MNKIINQMGPLSFFAEHPVFHYKELQQSLNAKAEHNPHTLRGIIQYHLAQGNIAHIRRGYYIVISTKLRQSFVGNDHILIAGRMTHDAIISYHSALEFHALAYSLYHLVYFCSLHSLRNVVSEYGNYQQVAHPKPLRPDNIYVETKTYDRQGLDIKVTSIERTLVDCLDKPQFAGGWEEIWRSFETLNFLDIERAIHYALTLENATTVAKLGCFLEQYQEQFSVSEKQLALLEKNKPKSKHYIKHNEHQAMKYLKRWNLIIPNSIINKSWRDPDNDHL